ncbi:MAG TPA: AIR synthase-related protein, partial [Gaiellaceae bacterium]|nr:AIR synthase-related protein [Gaiellaceae bacterium]
KPLGTGLVLAAKGDVAEAARWMTTLNAAAAEALRPFSPNAVTDVTGFGLLGHAHEMAERSGVRIRVRAGALPALDGALEAARAGVRTGGDPRNRDFAAPHVESDGVPDDLLALAYDAQTAGGLLVSLPAEKSFSLEAEFARRELFVARIGAVEAGAGVVLEP